MVTHVRACGTETISFLPKKLEKTVAEAHKRIVLKGRCHHKEAETGTGGILPGMDGKLVVDSGVLKMVKNPDTSAATLARGGYRIPKEDGLQGGNIAGGGNYNVDTYAAGDPCLYYMPGTSGDEVNLLIKDGEVIAVGDFIIPEGGGSGLWIKQTTPANGGPFMALEALSPSGANGFVACERQQT